MGIVTLSFFKTHLGTDDLLDVDALGSLGSATDELLQHYLDAAEEWAVSCLGKPISDFNPVPASIKQAVCMMAAHLYQNREAALVGVNVYALPHGAADFLRPYAVAVTGYVPE